MDAGSSDPPQHCRRQLGLLLHMVPHGHVHAEAGVDGRPSLGYRGQLRTAKNELGLDHNETRSWHGWHRHVSLVMLAFAMMAVIRHRANTGPLLKKTRPRPRPTHRS